MTAAQEKHLHFILLAIGALTLLLFLMRRSATAAEVVQAAAPDNGTYPNGNPIQLGDINIGGSPQFQSYNVPVGGRPDPDLPPISFTAPCGGCDANCTCGDTDNGCGASGFVTSRSIAPTAIQSAQANMQSFFAKL